MRLVGYVRVSTDEQNNSIVGQKDKIKGYCELNEHELIDIKVDDGYSAATMDRLGLKEALAMLTKGQADGILVAKLDRLTRSLVHLNQMIQDYFLEHTLISWCEHIDTSTASGRLVLNLLMTVSQWEREVIAERTKDTARQYKDQHKYWGTAPYGYMVSEGKKVVLNPEEQEIIRLVKEKAEHMSQRKIAAWLNENGYKNRRGNRFMQTQIAHILKENR